MKKRTIATIAMMIVLAMALALFAGCGPQGEGAPDISPDDQIENPSDTDQDGDLDSNNDQDQGDSDLETESPGGQEDGQNSDSGNPGKDQPSGNDKNNSGNSSNNNVGSNQIKDKLEDLVGKIYGITKIDQEIAIETNKIDLGNKDIVLYNLGLDDVSGIEEAVVSEALMTTQAYSMVLAKAKEGGDADQIAKQIKKGIDPQKWICVMADDVSVAVYGNVILLVMINSGMDDVATSKTIMSAMNEVSGIKGKII